MTARPRILFVTDHCLGNKSGYGLRIGTTLRGLEQVGDVETLFLSRDVKDDTWPDSSPTVIRANEFRARLGYVMAHLWRRPKDSLYRNKEELIDQTTPLLATPFDLIWVFRARPLTVVGPALDASPNEATPLVVDFDDLYDLLLEQESHADSKGEHRLKSAAKRVALRLDARRWRAHQLRVAARSTLALVTSAEDRDHLGLANVRVLPNAYPAPSERHQPAARSDNCTIVFVGGLHYQPNADAAKMLATEVLPLVRNQLPGATLVLVGRAGPVLDDIEQLPGVRYLGFADDLDEVFASASVVATPIRSGAGSRLKVLEAMGRRIPLVSTTFGVQGFDVRHDEHLLISDSSAGMADAILRLHNEPETAQRLVHAANELFGRRYERTVVASTTSQIAIEAMQPRSRLPAG